MLVPLKGSLRGGGEEEHVGDDGKAANKKDDGGGENEGQATNKGSDVQIHAGIQGLSLQNNKARLISFESTDPEFDEDSDPDADLDL
eukprot:gene35229-42677_t